MPADGSDATVLVGPLDGTLCGIVLVGKLPVFIQVIGEEINAPDGGLLAGLLLDIGELRLIVLDESGGRIRIVIVVVGTAHFLLTGKNVVAVHTAQVSVEPLRGVVGVRIGQRIRGRKLRNAFVRLGQSKAVQVGIAPVALQLNAVAALPQGDQRGNLAPLQIIGEGGFSLIGAVDVQILHLFVGVIGLQIADIHIVQPGFFHLHCTGNGTALVGQIHKAAAGGIRTVVGIACIVGVCPACIVLLGTVDHALFKLVGGQCVGGYCAAGKAEQGSHCHSRSQQDGQLAFLFSHVITTPLF